VPSDRLSPSREKRLDIERCWELEAMFPAPGAPPTSVPRTFRRRQTLGGKFGAPALIAVLVQSSRLGLGGLPPMDPAVKQSPARHRVGNSVQLLHELTCPVVNPCAKLPVEIGDLCVVIGYVAPRARSPGRNRERARDDGTDRTSRERDDPGWIIAPVLHHHANRFVGLGDDHGQYHERG
jgi:hypothetical protein